MKILKYVITAGILLSSALTFAQNHTKMNLKQLHPEDKGVQTNMMFPAKDGKVISLQILKGSQLKEHTTAVPALLVCVKGKVVFEDEKGQVMPLKSGDYVKIEPDVKHWVDAKTDSNLLLIK